MWGGSTVGSTVPLKGGDLGHTDRPAGTIYYQLVAFSPLFYPEEEYTVYPQGLGTLCSPCSAKTADLQACERLCEACSVDRLFSAKEGISGVEAKLNNNNNNKTKGADLV